MKSGFFDDLGKKKRANHDLMICTLFRQNISITIHYLSMTAVTHEGERNANRPAWEVFPKRDGKDENQRVCLYIQKTMYRIVYPHNFGSVFQCIYLISKMEIFTNVFPIFVFLPMLP